MFDVADIIRLQTETVARWHEVEISNPYIALNRVVCQQHEYNFRLWHEEDIARSPDVGDEKIAEVKRAIDKLNQQRNDWIEKIDDYITAYLESKSIEPFKDAKLNTETPGSAIDRLSIMSLRVYHLEEQLEREDADESLKDSVRQKIARCKLQQADLANSLQELIDEICAGTKRHQTYRQFKMYNDPTLNPYLYKKSA